VGGCSTSVLGVAAAPDFMGGATAPGGVAAAVARFARAAAGRAWARGARETTMPYTTTMARMPAEMLAKSRENL
jgi:hypothetical protein